MTKVFTQTFTCASDKGFLNENLTNFNGFLFSFVMQIFHVVASLT
ncbi:hypothetical protein SEHO0A_02725 [Salmonella enterica subsp. houtenae str. ATCC BAA-1581]|nr:hypothetical protein SEHO0A_02725 [Salmonella enterica subsp. houtenae str. ATCC BAA-1581]